MKRTEAKLPCHGKINALLLVHLCQVYNHLFHDALNFLMARSGAGWELWGLVSEIRIAFVIAFGYFRFGG